MTKFAIFLSVWLLSFGVIAKDVSHRSTAPHILPQDSLHSVMWSYIAKEFILSDTAKANKIVMDKGVKVFAPKVAEDQFNVPVRVDARALGEVKKIIVLADLNPLPKVLSYQPVDAEPVISFRIKVEQGTPVRAAVLTSDNVWHIGGTYVDASGGGCSAPAVAHSEADWVSHLAEVKAKVWRTLGKRAVKLRVRVRHPMDTGLADGIPAFYLETLNIKTPEGKLLGYLQLYEPISENPTLTLSPKLPANANALRLEGRDNEGNEIKVSIPAVVQSSELNQSSGVDQSSAVTVQ